MRKHTAQTSSGDAPLSKVKHADPRAMPEATADTESNDAVAATTVTIDRPRRELYDFWRDLSNLPTFMDNIERIDVLDDRRSHWVVQAPASQSVEWDSIISEDRPGERIAWETTPDS